MIISRYTFLFPLEDNYYVYNTLSNALIEIDENSYHVLKKNQSGKTAINKELIDKDLYDLLEEKRFITCSNEDDFLVYKSIIDFQRNDVNHMHLTIAPTMDCNFSCFYCFEKREETYITSDIIDSLVKHIEKLKDLKDIRLTWFGGEPLMAIDKMKEIYDKLSGIEGKNITGSNIITTAYHINPEVIEILKAIKIDSIQITLDGNKETHNKIKYTKECPDVFSRIIQNIDLLAEKAPEIHIVVRVNLTKANADEYVELFRFLANRYQGKKFGIAPAIVNDKGSTPYDNTIFFKRKEYAQYILNLYNNYSIHSPMLRYPSRFFSECAIRNRTAMSIDPEGYVYKCWEIIGNRKYAIGKLVDGEIVDINYTVLNRQLYGADTLDDKICSKCSYLPICNGGCPIHRIENKFEGKNNEVCTCHKDFLPEFFKIHLKLKQAGFSNQ